MRARSEDILELILILKLVLQFVDFCFRCFELEHLIKLIIQHFEGTYLGEKTFRNQNTAVVFALLSSLADVVTDVVHNVL